MDLLQKNIDQIKQLCVKYHVMRLYVFGPILTNRFNQNSDIDLLVDFGHVDLLEYADNYFDFKYALEDLFHKDVDLIDNKAITNPYFKEKIDRTKMKVFQSQIREKL